VSLILFFRFRTQKRRTQTPQVPVRESPPPSMIGNTLSAPTQNPPVSYNETLPPILSTASRPKSYQRPSSAVSSTAPLQTVQPHSSVSPQLPTSPEDSPSGKFLILFSLQPFRPHLLSSASATFNADAPVIARSSPSPNIQPPSVPTHELTDRQAQFVHNLYNLNVPAPAVASVISQMLRMPEEDAGPSDMASDQAPPYDFKDT
jgi:hypothetical protein